MEEREIFTDMAARTNGNIYIGVVGPVRTGKSSRLLVVAFRKSTAK